MTVKDRLNQGGLSSPEPIVSGLLFNKSVAVLGAQDDSFKTHFTIQLAICLTLGIPCYSFSTKPSYVAYMVLEGGESYI